MATERKLLEVLYHYAMLWKCTYSFSIIQQFTSSNRAARWFQPKGSTQGLCLKQIWEVWHFQSHFHGHLFAGDLELTQPCLIKGILWAGPSGIASAQDAVSGAQSWAGLIRKKHSALHAIVITVLMTPREFIWLPLFQHHVNIFTDDCLLLQSDCGSCARAWFAFICSGQGTKQNGSHRKMHQRCTSTGVMHQSILAMLGSFTSIRLQELQLSFARFPSFVLLLIKAQWLPGLIQHVRMKLSQEKKAGSFTWFSMFFSAQGTNP